MATKPVAHTGFTDDQILELPLEGFKVERVAGELVVSPAGWEHGRVVTRLLGRLQPFVESRGLGEVFGPDSGFDLPGGNMRSPDVSVVTAARFAGVKGQPFPAQVPDLVVEVVSPWDRPQNVRAKVDEYLREGARLVWVIEGAEPRAMIFAPGRAPRALGPGDSLDGEDLLPGFSVRLADLFTAPRRG